MNGNRFQKRFTSSFKDKYVTVRKLKGWFFSIWIIALVAPIKAISTTSARRSWSD
jgi:hypothetical protein